jgi:hypothetical protein
LKINNKSKTIIVASLLIAVTLFIVFHLKEKKESVEFSQPLSVETQNNVKSMTVDDASDLYCRIVLIPKSMVPTIEEFPQHKSANNIKTLPARIEWNNGCMIAIPQQTIFANDNAELSGTSGKDFQFESELPEEFADEEINKIHPALFYLFLSNVSKSQINY